MRKRCTEHHFYWRLNTQGLHLCTNKQFKHRNSCAGSFSQVPGFKSTSTKKNKSYINLNINLCKETRKNKYIKKWGMNRVVNILTYLNIVNRFKIWEIFHSWMYLQSSETVEHCACVLNRCWRSVIMYVLCMHTLHETVKSGVPIYLYVPGPTSSRFRRKSSFSCPGITAKRFSLYLRCNESCAAAARVEWFRSCQTPVVCVFLPSSPRRNTMSDRSSLLSANVPGFFPPERKRSHSP